MFQLLSGVANLKGLSFFIISIIEVELIIMKGIGNVLPMSML